jgi:2-amino-4-hydroxy-6-hydroxymethyldihydropteridine diphosphokinase
MRAYWREEVFIGIGSNVGKRERFIKKTLELIRIDTDIRIVRASTLIETEPVGLSKRKFLNGVLQIRTMLSPVLLLKKLKKIEKIVGRKNRWRWGPREIDLDILFFGERKIKTSQLQIPHPLIKQRDFVKIPLAQLIKNYGHI